MLQLTPLGVICLVGTAWIVWALPRSTTARGLAVVVVTCWCWYAATTLALAFGHTTLAFRMEPVVDVTLLAAGVFGIAEAAARVPTRVRVPVTALATLLAVLVPVAAVQGLGPDEAALTSYDPSGYTAEGVQDDAVQGRWAGGLVAATDQLSGRPADEVVLLSTVQEVTAFAPYRSFQAITPHYANPAADFEERQALLHRWAAAPDLSTALDASPYRAPDVLILRVAADGLHLSTLVDRFPQDPNVRYDDIVFRPDALAGFRTVTVGPFVVAAR